MVFAVATNNQKKLKEIQRILDSFGITAKTLRDLSIEIEIEENGTTFEENAIIKAKSGLAQTGYISVADDSGICITGLDDFPGVLTHRFLGEEATDDDRNNELINKTNSLSNRSAKVVCVLVYYDGKNTVVGEGVLEGKIATSPRGKNGFGFDSIFELPNGKTLAELTSEEKNKQSARYLAAIDLKEKIIELI